MLEVAMEAILFIWNNIKHIADSIKVPCVLTLIIETLNNPGPEKVNLFWALSFIVQTYLYIVIVVRLHRIFLLNETESSLQGSLKWRKNNTNYLLTSLAIGLIAAVIAAPFIFCFTLIFGVSEANSEIYMYVIMIPAGYVLSRISLVLPSVAINDKIDFSESWRISKGNGWKVFILLTIIPIVFNAITDILYFDHIALRPIYALLGIIFLIIEVIIFSNTYKKLILYRSIAS